MKWILIRAKLLFKFSFFSFKFIRLLGRHLVSKFSTQHQLGITKLALLTRVRYQDSQYEVFKSHHNLFRIEKQLKLETLNSLISKQTSEKQFENSEINGKFPLEIELERNAVCELHCFHSENFSPISTNPGRTS